MLNIMVYEVVCSENYLDIGLLIEKDYKSKPKRIRSRSSTYSSKSEYGGVSYINWIHTGIFLSEEEWNKITFDKPTDQIIKELHIKKKGKVMDKKKIDDIEINEESIITALKIIQQVCKDNYEHCSQCPFCVDVSENEWVCGITDLEPDNWKILEYKKFQALG